MMRMISAQTGARMADAKPSDAARALASARWGDRVLSRAVAVVVERADALTDDQVAELRAVAERKGGPDE